MNECKYPHLFKPIRLGSTLFRNRIFACPTDYPYFSHGNHATPFNISYFERKAMGGAASVAVGDCVVDAKRGLFTPHHLQFDDPEALPSLCQLTDAITCHGAVATAELIHGGMFSFGSHASGSKLYGPVECVHNGLEISEMSEDIIEETIEAFADAAAFAKYCGFGMVTVHGGHGWLLHQFLMPQLNTRKDQWGGDLENRARLPLAIVERIRRKCGNSFPIEMRISASECYPGGYDIDEGIAIAKLFDGKVDLINASVGHFVERDVFTLTHPSMFWEDGVNVKYAAAVKKAVSTPVSAVGALNDPEMMEEIIASGKADAVAVARALIADPDLPMKARAGREDEIRKCLRCFACLSGNATRRQIRCAINPEIGHELDMKIQNPPAVRKTVLVAGGGVSGMEAALTASARGHKVILCEKGDRLGGVLLCEKLVPFKRPLSDYLELQARLIARSDIEIRLNTTVTPELAQSLAPDVIIAAFGARPIVPKIKGIDGANVMGAEEAYVSPDNVGKRVVILGGGLVGTELGVFLAQKGREVTILEMMDQLNNGGNPLHGYALGQQINKLQMKVVLSTKAVDISNDGVTGEPVRENINLEPCSTIERAALDSSSYWQLFKADENNNEPRLYAADTVIYSVGQTPLWDEAEQIRCCAPEFHMIGDCQAPTNIEQATRIARSIARDIGRI
jgi:2,4-dienoyl-CoA reductase-like NADH-dependent reductase (Old Yellow Enzyme family)/thioredoxin reductase